MGEIKVLYVLNSLGFGGIENLVRDLCGNMDTTIFDFEVAVMSGKPLNQIDAFRAMNIKVHIYPELKPKTALKFVRWWKKFFEERKGYYNIVHIHTFTTAALYVKYAKLSGAYVIVHSHNVEPKKGTVKKRWNFIRKRLMEALRKDKYIDYRMACSEWAGKSVFGQKDFQVLNNGITVDKYKFAPTVRETVKKELGWKESLVIGHVGNGTGAKNQEFLLQVFLEIHKIYRDSRLVFVGKLASIQSRLEKYAEENDIREAVSILGIRSDVPQIMSAMDMFVFPSLYEGLGIVMIEAQAEGLVCVASDKVPSEAKISDWCSFYPLSRTAKEWAEYILRTWEEKKKIDRTQAWMAIPKSGYSIEQSAQKLQQIYLKAVQL